MVNFPEFYRGLSKAQRQAFCQQANVSESYVQAHLLYRSKLPRPSTIKGLAAASGGTFSYQDLLQWFYPEPNDKHMVSEPAA